MFSVARWEALSISALTLVFAGLLAFLAFQIGVTVDEPSHLLSSHLYWQGRDTLQPGDMPPLIKIIGGWVSHLTGFPLPPPNHPVWEANHEWTIGGEIVKMFDAKQMHWIFGWSRLPFILFPVACLLLIWWWARQLYSPAAALFAAALFALTPTVLGHGALFKNDLAASFALLAFAYRSWRLWQNCSLPNGLWLSAAALLGVLAKFSMLLLPLLAILVILAATLRARRPLQLLPLLLLGGMFLYVGILAAWQFDTQSVPDKELARWQAHKDTPPWFTTVASYSRYIPSPERFWSGIWTLTTSNGSSKAIYLLGNIEKHAHPAYFAIAYLLKTPFPLLLLTALGLLFALLEKRAATLFWLLPALLYLALASTSNLQFGLRLVLPSIACLSLAYAALGQVVLENRLLTSRLQARPIALLLALLIAAAPTVAAFPHYISYCNAAAGFSPGDPVRHLSDSNLDWGQGLPALGQYMQEHPEITDLKLFYFGFGWPGKWVPEHRHTQVAPPWSPQQAKGEIYQPEPGYYAISITLYTGQFFAPKYHNYFAAFRHLKPIAAPAGAILIFKVPPK